MPKNNEYITSKNNYMYVLLSPLVTGYLHLYIPKEMPKVHSCYMFKAGKMKLAGRILDSHQKGSQ